MKKLACVILAAALTLSLAACGGTKGTAAPSAAPAQTVTPAPTPAPTAKPAPAKLSPAEIAKAVNEAETAADLDKLIDAMEGSYAEDEAITVEGESITLKQIRELRDMLAAIQGAVDGTGNQAPAAVVPPSDSPAIGVWKGTYCKFVGDDEKNTSEPFALELRKDGTGTHYRDGMDFALTWTLSGTEFAMTESFVGTIEYTGTLKDGVLDIFNGDPKDMWSYEYVYEPGDENTIENVKKGVSDAPAGGESDTKAAGLARYRGDWNGALLFSGCTGKYAYLEDGVPVAAIARFAVKEDGSLNAFIGIDVEDTPFVNLKAKYDDFWECLMVSGSWINVPFEDIPLSEENGTLSMVIPIEKEGGSLFMVINLRRLGDEGWTDENPKLGPTQLAAVKGKTFGELAGMLGYDFLDYPSADEG